MIFARKVWKLLVAVKDGLALLFLALFFAAIYAVLAARPGPGIVREGALLLDLDGVIVEEPAMPDLFTVLISQEAPVGEYRARDVIRALNLAADDDRIKLVVLDLRGFLGGGFVHLSEIGDAIDSVRAAGKPVLSYGTAMLDDSVLIAGHASEAWGDPNGGAFIVGPGGNSLYFGRLLEKLKIEARVYRVGTFKSAVEPYIRNEPSPASREAYEAVYGSLWNAWQADYKKARPKADLELVTGDPVAWVEASGGSAPRAAQAAGLLDRLGTPTEFGQRVAELAGASPFDDTAGAYAHTSMQTFLGAHPQTKAGKAIGVITIAGTILDGDAGPGTAGGDRIVDLLNKAYDRDLAALIVRIDSPGGSLIASEHIRSAIARFKEKDIPIVASMANLGASGGYWVATPAEAIFAEPGTITGSIGVFSVIPTFERALGDLGVTAAGVKTTPLSGEPDVLGGFSPELDRMLQLSIENGYDQFIELVSKSRKINKNSSESWAEGRPWAGGDAQRLKLVDRFGDFGDAAAYAAAQAGLADGEWHLEDFGSQPTGFGNLLQGMQGRETHASRVGQDLAGLAAARQAAMVRRALINAQSIMTMRGAQALCLECPSPAAAATMRPISAPRGWIAALAQIFVP